MQHLKSYIALALALGPRSYLFRPLIEHFHTPEAIFAAGEEELRAVAPSIRQGTLSAILRNTRERQAEEIATWCRRNRVTVLPYDAPEYPARLRELAEPPIVLYCRGDLSVLGAGMSLGIVGTRKSDAYGVRVAYKLSFELAAAGAVIISGMADGVDGVAAAASLEVGMPTVAVLGSGIDIIYPHFHTRLAAEILRNGVIVTEYPPGTPPLGSNFPVRNRIISGLSSALLVVEAPARSGALITARYAILQGKTLFSVPGDIIEARSVGTNALIRDGALAAFRAEDVLSHFRFLYRDAVNERAFAEALQLSALSNEVIQKYGLQVVLPTEGEAEKEEKPQRRRRSQKRERGREETAPRQGEESPAAMGEAERASSLALLDERQREIAALLPEQPFSLDLLAERGIPAGEAAATLTVLEIYGLVAARPGGLYQKL